MKRLLLHLKRFLYSLASLILLSILYAIKLTLVTKRANFTKVNLDKKPGQPIFYFMWHKNGPASLAFAKCLKEGPKNAYLILSQNKSTQLLRACAMYLNYKVIFGSRHKGYLSSIKSVIEILSRDKDAAIILTPDGPRGPDMTIPDETIFKIAKKYKAQIRFFASMTSNIIELKTWDKTFILKPFSKGFVVNDSLFTDDEMEKMSPQQLREACEIRMQSAFNNLRQVCGYPAVIPGGVKKSRYEKSR